VKRSVLTLAVLVLLSLVPALPAAGPLGANRVTVTMTDYKFKLSKASVQRGTVVFTVVNRGEVVHDFKIVAKKTPIYEAGMDGSLKVTFKKSGRYPYLCTVPGHALAGMKGVLRVT
jgi:plastocyanin